MKAGKLSREILYNMGITDGAVSYSSSTVTLLAFFTYIPSCFEDNIWQWLPAGYRLFGSTKL